MTGLLGWLFVLGAPVVCALAGAGCAWAALARRHERELDTAYAQGWDTARDRAQAFYGSMQLEAEYARGTVATLLTTGTVVAAERLRALPEVHHDGPRHARPQEAAQDDYRDPLLVRIRADFKRIRMDAGLLSGPAGESLWPVPAGGLAIASAPEVGP